MVAAPLAPARQRARSDQNESPPGGGPAGDLRRAIAYAVGAAALFTAMAAVIKGLSPDYPLSQIIFARTAFGLIPLLPFMLRAGPGVFRTKRPWGHALRFVVGFMSMAASFIALSYLPLANHVALGYAAPLFVTALAIPLLGEVVRWRRWLATIVGFGGVLLMVRPDGAAFFDDGLFVGALWALFATFTYALVMIIIRRLSTTESSLTIVFYFTVSGSIVAGLFLPFEFVLPTVEHALLFVLIGILGGIGQILLTEAYRLGPVSVVAPFDYTGMVWALAFGFLLFGDVPSLMVILGAAIVIGSGLYILHRERTLGVAARRPPKPSLPLG